MPKPTSIKVDINAYLDRRRSAELRNADDDTPFEFIDGSIKTRKLILDQLDKDEELKIGNYIRISKKDGKVNFHFDFPQAEGSPSRTKQAIFGAMATVPYVGLLALGVGYAAWAGHEAHLKNNYEFQADTNVADKKFYKEVMGTCDIMMALCKPELSEMVVGPSTSPNAVFMREYMRSQGVPIQREAPHPGTKEYAIWQQALQQVEEVKVLRGESPRGAIVPPFVRK
jgi:hypothetical protein